MFKKAATFIKSLELKSISEAYSLTNQIKYKVANKTQKHLLYKQFVASDSDGCSVTPLTDFINDTIYPEVPVEEQYFITSDDRVYLDFRDSPGYTNDIEMLSRNDSKFVLKIELKNLLIRKMGLRVWRYLMGKYLYILGRSSLTLKYKTYWIVTQKDKLEE